MAGEQDTTAYCLAGLLQSSSIGAAIDAVLRALDRRTGNIAIGAEHATVSGSGFDRVSTTVAFIEILTGIRRHRLRRTVSANRAGNCRDRLESAGHDYHKARFAG